MNEMNFINYKILEENWQTIVKKPKKEKVREMPQQPNTLIQKTIEKVNGVSVCRFGENCKRRDTCTFYHEGDKPRICKFGKECRFKEKCFFSHDFPKELENQEKQSSPKLDKPINVVRKIECNFGLKCKFKDTTCKFSHDSTGLVKERKKIDKECNFGAKCKYKNSTCLFIHPENKTEEPEDSEEQKEQVLPDMKDINLFPLLSNENFEEKEILSFKDIKNIGKGIKNIFIQGKSTEEIITEVGLYPDVKRIVIKLW
jgi:hypothetical protein